MWKRIGVVAVWILATLGTASITLAAVSRVGGEVTERPAVPVVGADLATTTIQRSTSAASGTAAPVGTVATDPSAVVTSDSSVAPSTSPTTTSGSPSTTSSTSTTPVVSTTTTTAASYLHPTTLIGGTVTVQVSGNSLTLIAAIPKDGYAADVEDSGPSKVEVEFKSEGHDSKYQAEVRNGVLDIQTEEDEEGED